VFRINKISSFDSRPTIVQYSRWEIVPWLDHTITGPLYSRHEEYQYIKQCRVHLWGSTITAHQDARTGNRVPRTKLQNLLSILLYGVGPDGGTIEPTKFEWDKVNDPFLSRCLLHNVLEVGQVLHDQTARPEDGVVKRPRVISVTLSIPPHIGSVHVLSGLRVSRPRILIPCSKSFAATSPVKYGWRR